MRRIGLIGGMSWESTAEYYRLLNEGVRERLGGLHFADLLLHSVDFAGIEAMQAQGRWDDAAAALVTSARLLEAGGADFLFLCTSTMHKVAEWIEAEAGVPLLHIGDTTAEAVLATEVRRVGLLGTAFTMEQPFYVDRLARHGLDVVVPEAEDRALVHRVIYEELCLGKVTDASSAAYGEVMDRLARRGAEGPHRDVMRGGCRGDHVARPPTVPCRDVMRGGGQRNQLA